MKNEERQRVLEQSKAAREVVDIMTTGGSMEPLIKSESVVYIEFNHAENIRVGDVIAFYDKNGVSLHRCIGKKGGKILERGDGCNLWTKCNFISDKDIIGKMIYAEYKNQRLVIESFGYKLYSVFIVAVGKLSNRVGRIRKNDASGKPHVGLSEQGGSASRLINGFIKLLHKSLVKCEKTE